MADQTVTVEGDSGSKQNVAFKLWNVLRYELKDQGDSMATINQHLDLFTTCLQAASYGRKSQL